MIRRLSSEKLYELVKKRPGLSARQWTLLIGHNVTFSLDSLVKRGRAIKVKGLDVGNLTVAHLYYPKGESKNS